MIEKALIIRQPYLNQILSGGKIWEMRSRPNKVTGKIGLIEAGSGLVVGTCFIGRSMPPLYTERMAGYFQHCHKVEDLRLIVDKWRYPWPVNAARRLPKPVPYNHPKGAVIWVDIKHLGLE